LEGDSSFYLLFMLSQKSLKHLNKIEQKKFRQAQGEFIVEGVKGVKEAMLAQANVVLLVIEKTKDSEPDFLDLINLATKNDILIEYCNEKEAKKLKTTETFPGILAVIKQPKVILNDFDGTIICLDGVKDPGNLGTIIRTADWFGVKSILLSEDCVDLYNPKAVRSTMGSIFHLNILESTNVVQDLTKLQKNGYVLNGMVMNGDKLDKVNKKNMNIYVFGSESHGIRPEVEKMLDNKYTILGCPSAGYPRPELGSKAGQAESLNVAVACGILLSKI